ncbi:MAG: type II toxin-antitoxin system prevent-host-death family antitoxin [Pseudomonadales bacterium]|nr:type II toxin-antitoxin system prevent-host-death family antitoxin [Pseudomonadales bacterium]
MYTTRDIYPVSDFNRKTSEHIKRIQETRKPEVLTVNGKAAVVLVDPESYDQLAQNHDLLQTIRNIAIANEQHDNGQAKPAKQVFQELRAELKAKYPDAGL